MKIYVGIDVASEKHDCCIMEADRTVLRQFTFKNSIEGFEKLYSAMQSYSKPEDTIIGLESTGVYGNNLVAFLRRNGYETRTFNPLLIKKSIQATTLRKTKTDRSDARFLALFLTQELTQPDTAVSYHISELKSLCRGRFSLVQKRSEYKTEVKSIIVRVFPEFSEAFSDTLGAAATAVLKKYPSAEAVRDARIASLTKCIETASRGRIGRGKAEALKQLAANSIGTGSRALEIELRMCLEQIEVLSSFIVEYELEISTIMKELDSPITTVPGIGLVLGATILAEFGDISRFLTPAKMLAFSGMDPSVCESGKSVSSSGTMVKRGSKYLRWALGQAARCVAQFNPVFSAYLKKKMNEGKHYSVACSHVAKKLIRVLFSILKNNTPYSLDYAINAA